MKKMRIVYVFALIAILFIACDEILDQLDLTFTTGEQTVYFDAGPDKAGTYTFIEEVVISELEQEIEDNGGSIDNLKKATLNGASISIVSGASNLDAAGSFELRILTMDKEEIKMAWIENVPKNVTSVDLEVSPQDLKKFFEDEKYIISIGGTLVEDVESKINLKATVKYDVEVGL